MFQPRTIEPGAMITEPGFYSNIPILRYHGDDLFNGPHISSSGLRTIFSKSPMEYWIRSPMNPRRVESTESKAFILGRATHHLLLGEPGFLKVYAPQPKILLGKAWHGNRNDCKEWIAQRELEGKTVLTPEQWDAIRGMAGILPWQDGLEDSGLKNVPLVRAGILNGWIEHSLFWQDRETGIWLKGRPDAIPVDSGDTGDLKTTTETAYDELAKAIAEYRYDMQAALIREGMRVVLGLDVEHFYFIFIQNKEPFVGCVVELKPHELDNGWKDCRVALRTLRRCIDTKKWPGPGGTQADAVYIERPKWAVTRAEDRRIFLENELK